MEWKMALVVVTFGIIAFGKMENGNQHIVTFPVTNKRIYGVFLRKGRFLLYIISR